jgi:hypothetical protein
MPAIQATIANGAAVTDVIDIGTSGVLAGLKIPAMTTSTVITVQVAESPTGTFVNLFNAAGTGITAACSTSAARGVNFNPDDVCGWRYFKFQAGTGAGDAQTGAKTIIVMFRTRLD